MFSNPSVLQLAGGGTPAKPSSSVPSHDQKGFTPVRRVPRDYNTDISSKPSTAWTQTRCNRLLRPLTSRIQLLRKDASTVSVLLSESSSNVAGRGKENDSTTTRESEDQDWERARKRVKRTYSSKSRTTTAAATAKRALKESKANIIHSEMSIPTPVLCRIRGPVGNQEGPSQSAASPGDVDAQFQSAETLRRLRQASSSRYDLDTGLVSALKALLRATDLEPDSPDPYRKRGKGARSLLGTCLRAVPQYIREGQAYSAASSDALADPQSSAGLSDISDDTYSYLELLGTSHSGGWKHLRTVVRAHGVSLVREAFEQGLLEPSYCQSLVDMCTRMGYVDEAEIFMTVWLNTTEARARKSQATLHRDESKRAIPWRPLKAAFSYLANPAQPLHIHQYRLLTCFFGEGRLDASWLASRDFKYLWRGLFEDLTREEVSPEVCEYGTTAITVMCNREDHTSQGFTDSTCELYGLESTLKRVLTIITTIAMIHEYRRFSRTSDARCPMIRLVFKNCILACGLLTAVSYTSKTVLLALAFLVTKQNDWRKDAVDELLFSRVLKYLWSRDTQRPDLQLSNVISDFICSVALCCGRVGSTGAFDGLLSILETLELQLKNPMGRDRVIVDVIVDSAHAFARTLPDPKHLDYAEAVEKKFRGKQSLPVRAAQSPRESGNSAYRWEEGINEWVTKTPAISLLRSKGLFDDSSDEDSLDISRPIPRRIGNGGKVSQLLLRDTSKATSHVSMTLDSDEEGPCSDLESPINCRSRPGNPKRRIVSSHLRFETDRKRLEQSKKPFQNAPLKRKLASRRDILDERSDDDEDELSICILSRSRTPESKPEVQNKQRPFSFRTQSSGDNTTNPEYSEDELGL